MHTCSEPRLALDVSLLLPVDVSLFVDNHRARVVHNIEEIYELARSNIQHVQQGMKDYILYATKTQDHASIDVSVLLLVHYKLQATDIWLISTMVYNLTPKTVCRHKLLSNCSSCR